MTRIGVLLASITSLLVACTSSGPERYSAGTPPLALERFFEGRTTAIGTVSDRSGAVIRRIRVLSEGKWSEPEQALTVDEQWYWDDGSAETRRWRWEKRANGTWRGLEQRLVGEGVGVASGNTFHWDYTMSVDTYAYGKLSIVADDVMHLVDENDLINLVDMYYFGFHVGQIVLHIQRGDRPIEPWPKP